MFQVIQRVRDYLWGLITPQQLREDESSLTEHMLAAMKQGGDKLDHIFGSDKIYYYYFLSGMVAGMVLGDDADEEDIALISQVTPAIANLVIGTSDEIGLNEHAQYTIMLGSKEKP